MTKITSKARSVPFFVEEATRYLRDHISKYRTDALDNLTASLKKSNVLKKVWDPANSNSVQDFYAAAKGFLGAVVWKCNAVNTFQVPACVNRKSLTKAKELLSAAKELIEHESYDLAMESLIGALMYLPDASRVQSSEDSCSTVESVEEILAEIRLIRAGLLSDIDQDDSALKESMRGIEIKLAMLKKQFSSVKSLKLWSSIKRHLEMAVKNHSGISSDLKKFVFEVAETCVSGLDLLSAERFKIMKEFSDLRLLMCYEPLNSDVGGNNIHQGTGKPDRKNSKLLLPDEIMRFDPSNRIELVESQQSSANATWVASEVINPGDIVCVLRPVSSCLVSSNFRTRCWHCFSEIQHDFAPCFDCADVLFCDEHCREAGYEIHKLECEVLPAINSLFHDDDFGVLIYRLISSKSLDFWEADRRFFARPNACKRVIDGKISIVGLNQRNEVVEDYPDPRLNELRSIHPPVSRMSNERILLAGIEAALLYSIMEKSLGFPPFNLENKLHITTVVFHIMLSQFHVVAHPFELAPQPPKSLELLSEDEEFQATHGSLRNKARNNPQRRPRGLTPVKGSSKKPDEKSEEKEKIVHLKEERTEPKNSETKNVGTVENARQERKTKPMSSDSVKCNSGKVKNTPGLREISSKTKNNEINAKPQVNSNTKTSSNNSQSSLSSGGKMITEDFEKDLETVLSNVGNFDFGFGIGNSEVVELVSPKTTADDEKGKDSLVDDMENSPTLVLNDDGTLSCWFRNSAVLSTVNESSGSLNETTRDAEMEGKYLVFDSEEKGTPFRERQTFEKVEVSGVNPQDDRTEFEKVTCESGSLTTKIPSTRKFPSEIGKNPDAVPDKTSSAAPHSCAAERFDGLDLKHFEQPLERLRKGKKECVKEDASSSAESMDISEKHLNTDDSEFSAHIDVELGHRSTRSETAGACDGTNEAQEYSLEKGNAEILIESSCTINMISNYPVVSDGEKSQQSSTSEEIISKTSSDSCHQRTSNEALSGDGIIAISPTAKNEEAKLRRPSQSHGNAIPHFIRKKKPMKEVDYNDLFPGARTSVYAEVSPQPDIAKAPNGSSDPAVASSLNCCEVGVMNDGGSAGEDSVRDPDDDQVPRHFTKAPGRSCEATIPDDPSRNSQTFPTKKHPPKNGKSRTQQQQHASDVPRLAVDQKHCMNDLFSDHRSQNCCNGKGNAGFSDPVSVPFEGDRKIPFQRTETNERGSSFQETLPVTEQKAEILRERQIQASSSVSHSPLETKTAEKLSLVFGEKSVQVVEQVIDNAVYVSKSQTFKDESQVKIELHAEKSIVSVDQSSKSSDASLKNKFKNDFSHESSSKMLPENIPKQSIVPGRTHASLSEMHPTSISEISSLNLEPTKHDNFKSVLREEIASANRGVSVDVIKEKPEMSLKTGISNEGLETLEAAAVRDGTKTEEIRGKCPENLVINPQMSPKKFQNESPVEKAHSTSSPAENKTTKRGKETSRKLSATLCPNDATEIKASHTADVLLTCSSPMVTVSSPKLSKTPKTPNLEALHDLVVRLKYAPNRSATWAQAARRACERTREDPCIIDSESSFPPLSPCNIAIKESELKEIFAPRSSDDESVDKDPIIHPPKSEATEIQRTSSKNDHKTPENIEDPKSKEPREEFGKVNSYQHQLLNSSQTPPEVTTSTVPVELILPSEDENTKENDWETVTRKRKPSAGKASNKKQKNFRNNNEVCRKSSVNVEHRNANLNSRKPCVGLLSKETSKKKFEPSMKFIPASRKVNAEETISLPATAVDSSQKTHQLGHTTSQSRSSSKNSSSGPLEDLNRPRREEVSTLAVSKKWWCEIEGGLSEKVVVDVKAQVSPASEILRGPQKKRDPVVIGRERKLGVDEGGAKDIGNPQAADKNYSNEEKDLKSVDVVADNFKNASDGEKFFRNVKGESEIDPLRKGSCSSSGGSKNPANDRISEKTSDLKEILTVVSAMKSLPEDAPEFPTKSADASGKLADKVKGLDSEVSVSQDANSEIQEKSVLVRSREVSLVKERSGKETSNDQLNSNVSPPVIETVSVEFEEPAEGDSHFQCKFPIGKNVVLLPDDGKCSGKAKKKSYRKAAVGNERETPSKSSLVHDSDLSRETEGFKSIAAVKDSYPEVENKPGHSSSNHSNMSIGRGVVETCAQTSTASGEDGILSSGCRKTPDIPPGFEQLTTETRTPPLKAIEKFFSQNVSVEEFLNGSSANDEINYPRSVRKLSVSSSSNQSNTCDEVLCKTGTPATKPKSSTRQETSRNLRVTSGGGDGNPRTSTTTNSIKIADEFPLFVPKSSNKEAHARSHRRGRRKDSSAEQHLSMLATRFRLGRLAAGLYPDLKRFEHSCDPNSLVTECFGDVLVVRAVKRIEKGDRITMAFSGEKGEIKHPNMPKRERLEELKTNFNIHCKCNACAGNWREESPPNDSIIKCPSCQKANLMSDLARKRQKLCFHCKSPSVAKSLADVDNALSQYEMQKKIVLDDSSAHDLKLNSWKEMFRDLATAGQHLSSPCPLLRNMTENLRMAHAGLLGGNCSGVAQNDLKNAWAKDDFDMICKRIIAMAAELTAFVKEEILGKDKSVEEAQKQLRIKACKAEIAGLKKMIELNEQMKADMMKREAESRRRLGEILPFYELAKENLRMRTMMLSNSQKDEAGSLRAKERLEEKMKKLEEDALATRNDAFNFFCMWYESNVLNGNAVIQNTEGKSMEEIFDMSLERYIAETKRKPQLERMEELKKREEILFRQLAEMYKSSAMVEEEIGRLTLQYNMKFGQQHSSNMVSDSEGSDREYESSAMPVRNTDASNIKEAGFKDPNVVLSNWKNSGASTKKKGACKGRMADDHETEEESIDRRANRKRNWSDDEDDEQTDVAVPGMAFVAEGDQHRSAGQNRSVKQSTPKPNVVGSSFLRQGLPTITDGMDETDSDEYYRRYETTETQQNEENVVEKQRNQLDRHRETARVDSKYDPRQQLMRNPGENQTRQQQSTFRHSRQWASHKVEENNAKMSPTGVAVSGRGNHSDDDSDDEEQMMFQERPSAETHMARKSPYDNQPSMPKTPKANIHQRNRTPSTVEKQEIIAGRSCTPKSPHEIRSEYFSSSPAQNKTMNTLNKKHEKTPRPTAQRLLQQQQTGAAACPKKVRFPAGLFDDDEDQDEDGAFNTHTESPQGNKLPSSVGISPESTPRMKRNFESSHQRPRYWQRDDSDSDDDEFFTEEKKTPRTPALQRRPAVSRRPPDQATDKSVVAGNKNKLSPGDASAAGPSKSPYRGAGQRKGTPQLGNYPAHLRIGSPTSRTDAFPDSKGHRRTPKPGTGTRSPGFSRGQGSLFSGRSPRSTNEINRSPRGASGSDLNPTADWLDFAANVGSFDTGHLMMDGLSDMVFSPGCGAMSDDGNAVLDMSD